MDSATTETLPRLNGAPVASGGRRPAPPTGLAATLAVARSGAGALRGRRRLGMLALVGLPVLIQVVVLIWGRGRGSAFNNFVHIVDLTYLRIIAPLVLIFVGTAAFGDEWEGGTACYLLGAPIQRRTLVLGRWAAATTRAVALLLPAITVLYVLCLLPFEGAMTNYLGELGAVLLAMLLMCLGYASVFVFLGLALKRSVMTSFIIVLVFEGLMGNLPYGFGVLSLGFHARNLVWRITGHEGFRPPSFGLDIPEPISAVYSTLFTLLAGAALFLVLSVWVLRRKQFGGAVQSDGGTG
jgi:ABC-type transport system involved in multi-copper enzyme maturation permease subunit